ncbi:MAG: DUF4011 domain-containing protein [Clostridia bacterium]|nr:DUF4011 domain-containing protein [Clostridia bacterium]
MAKKTVSIQQSFDTFASRLLDQSRSNRMIHYRTSARQTLDLIDPSPSDLFEAIVTRGRELSFRRPIDRKSAPRTYTLLSLLSALNHPVEVTVGDIGYRGDYQKAFDALTHMRRRNRLAHEEQGCHILYLVFGFVIWQDGKRSQDGNLRVKSPLLLVPVTLNQTHPSAPFTVKKTDDDIVVNPALAFMLEKNGISLPAFDEGNETLAEYFETIELMAEEHGWEIVKSTSIGLLSFQKISMYKDLEAHREELLKNRFLRALANDKDAFDPLPTIDPDSESYQRTARVLSADSSQMQAILAARAGYSFVMEGPPGTGKSQTIANIIADALLSGKKVLFVSSKNAALQVVYRRLEETGLAPFCLDIHNHKANKVSILQDIEKTLTIRAMPLSEKERLALHELDELRDEFNRYAEAVHTSLDCYPITPYLLASALSELFEVPTLPLSKLPASEAEFFHNLRLAAHYDTAKREYLREKGTIPHALCGLLVYETDAITILQEAAITLGNALVTLSRIGKTHGIRLDALPFSTLFETASLFAAIDTLPPSCRSLLSGDSSKELCDTLRSYLALGKEKEALEETVEALANESIYAFSPEEYHLTCRSHTVVAARDPVVVALIGNRRLTSLDRDTILRATQTACAMAEEAHRLTEAVRRFGTACHMPLAADFASLEALLPYLAYIGEDAVIPSRWYSRDTARDLALLRDARFSAEAIKTLENKLVTHWQPNVFEIDWQRLKNAFQYMPTLARIGFFASGQQREIRRLLKTYTLKPHNPTDDEISALFDDLEALDLAKKQFLRHEAFLRNLAATAYRGAHTDFDTLEKNLSVCAGLKTVATVPPAPIDAYFNTQTVFRKSSEAVTALRELSDALEGLKSLLSPYPTLFATLKNANAAAVSLNRAYTLLNAYETLDKSLTSHLKRELSAVERDRLLADLSRRHAILKEQKALEDKIAATVGDKRLPIADLIAALTPLSTLLSLREQDGALYRTVLALCGEKRSTAKGLSEALVQVSESAEHAFTVLDDAYPARNLRASTVGELRKLVTALLESLSDLRDYAPVARAFFALHTAGLSEFVADYEEKALSEHLENVLKKSTYEALYDRVRDEREILKSFSRKKQSERMARFAALDEKSLAIARRNVRYEVAKRIPQGERNWRGKDELTIFEDERQKKRHMPLRKLFSQIPQLLLTLKPCFMMSPLSVSYFLERDAYTFDLVIFDEASQLFPEDAIGAIRRSKQIIVAGDSKQLPPTDFFSAKNDSDEDEEDEEEESGKIMTSILENAREVMPCHMLRWHYRSNFESLIAFSNHTIYQSKLVTFPSPNDDCVDCGVEYIYVPNGVYEPKEGRNRKEADACVRELEKHILTHPDHSLGIIAFGKKQQRAIENAVTDFRIAHPEYEAFFAEGKDEPFFIKNLENVQGDERDTVIFSIGYGKNAKGRFSLNLGPLTKEGGERRLNVAITRAKYNIKLIGSVQLSDFDLSRTESAGVKLLYRYIDYALHKSGVPGLENTEPFETNDTFLQTVCEKLTAQGYTVKKHLGTSDCRVDLAVYHPFYKNAIAALMTDGNSYRTAPCARDREHLRYSVLRRMGWRVYHLFAGEWAKHALQEEEALLAFLKEATEAQNELESTLVSTVSLPSGTSDGDSDDEIPADDIPSATEDAGDDQDGATNSCHDTPYGFSYYREADCFRAPIRNPSDKDGVIADRMRYLVEKEEPIAKDVLFRRLAPTFRTGRLTETVKKTLHRVLEALLDKGELYEISENFFTISENSPITVRIPAPGSPPRSLDEVATAELAQAMLTVIKDTFGVTPNALFQEVIRLFGYERMSARLTSHCDRALYTLLMREEVVAIDGTIRLRT